MRGGVADEGVTCHGLGELSHFTAAMQVTVATATQRGMVGVVAHVIAVVPAAFALGGGAGLDLYAQVFALGERDL